LGKRSKKSKKYNRRKLQSRARSRELPLLNRRAGPL
jgi:hypothetical protein